MKLPGDGARFFSSSTYVFLTFFLFQDWPRTSCQQLVNASLQVHKLCILSHNNLQQYTPHRKPYTCCSEGGWTYDFLAESLSVVWQEVKDVMEDPTIIITGYQYHRYLPFICGADYKVYTCIKLAICMNGRIHCSFTWICTCTCVCICTCMTLCECVCTCTCTSTYMHVHSHTNLHYNAHWPQHKYTCTCKYVHHEYLW